jgi:hypothetical protein
MEILRDFLTLNVTIGCFVFWTWMLIKAIKDAVNDN